MTDYGDKLDAFLSKFKSKSIQHFKEQIVKCEAAKEHHKKAEEMEQFIDREEYPDIVRWNPYTIWSGFNGWLELDGKWYFYDTFTETFDEQFKKYKTDEMDKALYAEGRSLMFALKGYINHRKEKGLTIEEVIEFFDCYMKEVEREIRDWCDVGTVMWMNEDVDKLTDEEFEAYWECKKPAKIE
jgi:hypothetical protein